MAPRALATGTIAFGMVSIPVKLYSAANPSSGLSFRLLSPAGHRVKQQYVDPEAGGAVIPRGDLVKGYELGEDRYVVFTEDELKALVEPATQSIDLDEFIAADEVPRVYQERAYYLAPDRGGARAYRLLAAALSASGRVGLGRYAARGKQHLVMVAPLDDGLVMYQLHYPDEVQSFGELPRADAEVKGAELALAMELIAQRASGEFHPERYRDEVKARVEAAIEEKLRGEAVTVAPPPPTEARVVDLVAALKASLGAAPAAPVTSHPRRGRALGE
jgi:DNA end-binding protein Ku